MFGVEQRQIGLGLALGKQSGFIFSKCCASNFKVYCAISCGKDKHSQWLLIIFERAATLLESDAELECES